MLTIEVEFSERILGKLLAEMSSTKSAALNKAFDFCFEKNGSHVIYAFPLANTNFKFLHAVSLILL